MNFCSAGVGGIWARRFRRSSRRPIAMPGWSTSNAHSRRDVAGLRFRCVADRVDGKKPRLRIFVEPKKAGQHRVDDVDNAPRATNHKPRKIGMKINRNAIGKDAAPVERYIHDLAYFAVRAVGADQILAGERTLLTALNIFGEDSDAFLLLLDID